jgi:hypothetical protein
VRTSEGAFFVTEKFALQKVFGNGVAVDRDKRAILALAAMMNRRGCHFFSRAAFSEQEHRSIRPGYLANESKNCLHLRTGAEHIFKHIRKTALL